MTEAEKTIPEAGQDTTIESSNRTIEETREELAKAYLTFLDQQKGGIVGTGAGLGINLNPLQKSTITYLTSDTDTEKQGDIFKTIGKNIKKKVMEHIGMQGSGIEGIGIEYDKAKLDRMKSLIIANKDNQTKLQELMDQIASGIDPTLTTVTGVVTDQIHDSNNENVVEYMDKNKRERVLTTLDTILEEDKMNPIPYLRGGRVDPTKGLDCSGLLYYTMDRAGLDVSVFTSRTLFSQLPAKRVEYEKGGAIKKNLGNIKKGDVIFWNSVNKKYKRSTGAIPTTTKDGIDYRIHHIAFVDKINYADGTVDVIESNGSQGVTKSTINVKDRLEKKGKQKSELYVAHMNYNNLPDKKTNEQQNLAA